MESKSIALGDPHFFGQRVCRVDEHWVDKPRTTAWERLFLTQSPLKTFFLQNLTTTSKALHLIPNLEYPTPKRVAYVSPDQEPTPADWEEFDDWSGLGALIGLFTWMGAIDLHHENAVFRWMEGRICFLPLDLEGLLSNHRLPSQTLLIATASAVSLEGALFAPQKALNTKPLEEQKRRLQEILEAYLSSLNELDHHRSSIKEKLLGSLRGETDLYLRVLLRSTEVYRSPHPEIQFLPEEIAQREAGDIPYFFRQPESREILWLSNPGGPILPIEDQSILDPAFLTTLDAPGPDAANSRHLQSEGLLQLARYFDLKTPSWNLELPSGTLLASENLLKFETRDRRAIECSRESLQSLV